MCQGTGCGRVIVGNADDDGQAHRGWLVGHFAGSSGVPTYTEAVEVKWGVHPAGERRVVSAVNATATSLSLLVRGRFRLGFPERAVVLEREGDYALWPPGVAHDWHAEEESVVVTIRWPSLPADHAPVGSRPWGDEHGVDANVI